jgi:MoxR-like ATPase
VLFLALKMGRPIFLEGEAGVGKTEIAKVLSSTLGRRLIRLQCYEGLDVAAAVYEWNYAAQMIAIRVAEAQGEHDRERLEHDRHRSAATCSTRDRCGGRWKASRWCTTWRGSTASASPTRPP